MPASRATVLALALLPLALAGCLGSAGDDDAAPPAEDPVGPTGDMGNETASNDTAPPPEPENGSASPEPTPAQRVQLEVATSGQYPANAGFAPTTLSAPAGAIVELTFRNADALPVFRHDWVLEGVSGAYTDAIMPGETAEITFTAPEPGTYTYFCSVGDHRERGMAGTFTVT